MSQAQNLKKQKKTKKKTGRTYKKSQKTHRVYLKTQVVANPVIGTVFSIPTLHYVHTYNLCRPCVANILGKGRSLVQASAQV